MSAVGPIVGIDLGTTNSLVAYVEKGSPRVLSSREGRSLVPSVVAFLDHETKVGFAAKQEKIENANRTAYSVKRLLGRSYEDLKSVVSQFSYDILPEDGVVKIRIGGKKYSVIEISALILKELKVSAEKALGCGVGRAVITVPAYFNDSQRQATRAAGRLAGFEVLRILNEPTAAALAYGLDRKKEGLIAVYDLGGGTFDISILKLQNGIFEVLSTNGNTSLGGDDLDQAVVRVIQNEIQKQYPLQEILRNQNLSNQFKANLIDVAENMKIALSEKKITLIKIDFENIHYEREWSREEFNTLARPILEKTKAPCFQALKDAGITEADLTDVVMVGGPTRLDIVQEVAREIFNKNLNTSMHPDEVVALGAAVQADILAGNNRELLLLDVVPLSLGIETYGGLVSCLIPRNSKIPCSARETFTTFVNNQTSVDIHVLQGERESALENRSLARFKLRVEPLSAGLVRVEVQFLIDADGILQVYAKDLITGLEQAVEVKPSYGLTDAEIERMLLFGLEKPVKEGAQNA